MNRRSGAIRRTDARKITPKMAAQRRGSPRSDEVLSDHTPSCVNGPRHEQDTTRGATSAHRDR